MTPREKEIEAIVKETLRTESTLEDIKLHGILKLWNTDYLRALNYGEIKELFQNVVNIYEKRVEKLRAKIANILTEKF